METVFPSSVLRHLTSELGGGFLTTNELLTKCVEIARDKKAINIMTMDLSGITLICDHFLLMTASNTRQGQALSDYMAEGLKELAHPPLRIEGYKEGRWILLDFGSIVVHIFQEEERKYYNLERLWGDAKMQLINSNGLLRSPSFES